MIIFIVKFEVNLTYKCKKTVFCESKIKHFSGTCPQNRIGGSSLRRFSLSPSNIHHPPKNLAKAVPDWEKRAKKSLKRAKENKNIIREKMWIARHTLALFHLFFILNCIT